MSELRDPLFDEWRAYQKLLEHDYMYHGSFFTRLKDELQRHFHEPVSILDLGCGDASSILTVLEEVGTALYCGLDQSETALSMAESNLASTDIPYRLYPGDLQYTLRTVNGSFDVIVASFSLHHLEGAESKGGVLRDCRRRLNRGGLVAVIDVFRDEDETREHYLERWIDFAVNSYVALDQSEITTLVEHVRDNDFPETLSTYRSIGNAAGFDTMEVLMEDREHLNHLVILR